MSESAHPERTDHRRPPSERRRMRPLLRMQALTLARHRGLKLTPASKLPRRRGDQTQPPKEDDTP